MATRGIQLVRVLDVVAIGPFMIFAGVTQSTLPKPVRVGLGLLGIATILFNGVNFVRKV